MAVRRETDVSVVDFRLSSRKRSQTHHKIWKIRYGPRVLQTYKEYPIVHSRQERPVKLVKILSPLLPEIAVDVPRGIIDSHNVLLYCYYCISWSSEFALSQVIYITVFRARSKVWSGKPILLLAITINRYTCNRVILTIVVAILYTFLFAVDNKNKLQQHKSCLCLIA